jgi:hypothetical protein
MSTEKNNRRVTNGKTLFFRLSGGFCGGLHPALRKKCCNASHFSVRPPLAGLEQASIWF